MLQREIARLLICERVARAKGWFDIANLLWEYTQDLLVSSDMYSDPVGFARREAELFEGLVSKVAGKGAYQ